MKRNTASFPFWNVLLSLKESSPVSYTHLDVYKRQVSLIRGVLGSMHIMIEQKEATVIFEETEPVSVSYTHLDVYKRQLQGFLNLLRDVCCQEFFFRRWKA